MDFSPQKTEVILLLAIDFGLLFLLFRIKKAFPVFILFSYSLVFASTVVATLDGFHPIPIFILATVLTTLLWYFLGFRYLDFSVSKKSFFIATFLLLSFVGFQVQEHFVGGQDAVSDYLPFCRYVSTYHVYPTDRADADNPYLSQRLGYPPAIIELGSLVFMATGVEKEWMASIVPTIFFLAFLIIVFRWAEEEGVNPNILGFFIFTTPFFIERGSWFFSEIIVTFSVTLMFYMLYKHSQKNEYIYIAYGMLAAVLAIMSKVTGVFFIAFVIFYLVWNKELTRRNCLIFLILGLPYLVWSGRSLYYLTSPMYPYLNFLTLDKEITDYGKCFWILDEEISHRSARNTIINIGMIPLLFVWAIIFPMSEKFKDTFFRYKYYFFLVYLFLWFTVFQSRDVRLIMLFYGSVLVLLAIHLREYYLKSQWAYRTAEYIEHRINRTVYFLGVYISLLVITLFFQHIYITKIFPDHLSPTFEAIRFLTHEEGAQKGTRLYTDTEHGLTWYGNYTVFHPLEPFFSKEIIECRKSLDPYELFKKYDIKYAINHPWKGPWDGIFSVIDKDNTHFKKVYRSDNLTIWKLVDK